MKNCPLCKIKSEIEKLSTLRGENFYKKKREIWSKISYDIQLYLLEKGRGSK